MANYAEVDLYQKLRLSLFLYGANGVGKTHLARTLKGKMCLANYNGNPQVLVKFPPGDTTVIQGPPAYNDIVRMCADSYFDQFDIFCLDAVTGLYRILLDEIVKTVPNTRTLPGVPALQDYQLASERLRNVIRDFTARKDRQHIIATAHERVERDEVTQAAYGGPSVPGQVPAYICDRFGEMLYINMVNDKRVAHVKKYLYFPAATRLLDLKDVENPNLDTMYGKFI